MQNDFAFSNSDEKSPFGGKIQVIETLECDWVVQEYLKKTGIDFRSHFEGVSRLQLMECELTGYRYWSPAVVAGDEKFYRMLGQWSDAYYRTERWEYKLALKLARGKNILEVGSGRGYFLHALEGSATSAVGLELNQDAINRKVTSFDIRQQLLEEHLNESPSYDAIFSFQVLEHLVDPASFISSCRSMLSEGGRLVISTPNYESIEARNKLDCFDLPPHHMGHFTEESYRKIADLLDFEVERVAVQRRGISRRLVTDKNSRRAAWRLFDKIVGFAERILYAYLSEPGHTVVVVLRKTGNHA